MIVNPLRHPWFAIQTRSRHESKTVLAMEGKGYKPFLPTCRTRRRWSDRVVDVDVPLFPGYVFCRIDIERRLPVLTTPGVVSIVGIGREPCPVDEAEILAIEALQNSGLAAEPWPYLHAGDRVRVTRGAMENVEGILVKKKDQWRMVISVELLQRSVAVEIDADWITPVPHLRTAAFA